MARNTVAAIAASILACSTLLAQNKVAWNEQEEPIVEKMRGLRKLPDNARSRSTRRLAIEIRQVPTNGHMLILAMNLANLATEGDLGKETLQEVATTLGTALQFQPTTDEQPYLALAQLLRYEHVETALDTPALKKAMAKLEADDEHRAHLDFTLNDLQDKTWSLSALRGKVVLVNFWATWCSPCRKEMPDLQALHERFGSQGFVILSISAEDRAKVAPFIAEQKITYPVLLDPGRKVTEMFRVDGIPKTYVYDREGKLVAQAIDMRTAKQFLEMLGKAGLR